MTWNSDETQQHFSELLDAAEQSSQMIYQHNQAIAAVIRANLLQEFLSWQVQQQPQSLAQAFSELRQLCVEEDYTFACTIRTK